MRYLKALWINVEIITAKKHFCAFETSLCSSGMGIKLKNFRFVFETKLNTCTTLILTITIKE